jgi:flagellar biosynthesis protein
MSDVPDRASPGPLRAAALSYEARDAAAGGAPRVVAKGQGVLAEQIIRLARENSVPIHQSRELASALTQFDVDQTIPPALYVAVAEVLAWAYQVEIRSGADAAPATRAAPGFAAS